MPNRTEMLNDACTYVDKRTPHQREVERRNAEREVYGYFTEEKKYFKLQDQALAAIDTYFNNHGGTRIPKESYCDFIQLRQDEPARKYKVLWRRLFDHIDHLDEANNTDTQESARTSQ